VGRGVEEWLCARRRWEHEPLDRRRPGSTTPSADQPAPPAPHLPLQQPFIGPHTPRGTQAERGQADQSARAKALPRFGRCCRGAPAGVSLPSRRCRCLATPGTRCL
jgi:hypothetical protein